MPTCNNSRVDRLFFHNFEGAGNFVLMAAADLIFLWHKVRCFRALQLLQKVLNSNQQRGPFGRWTYHTDLLPKQANVCRCS